MTITMKREALLQKLAEKLELAKAHDEKVAAKHRDDEQAALKKFKDRLRDILKYDYGKMKSINHIYFDRPSCPDLASARIQRVIDLVKLDTRKIAFRISERSDIERAILWVPESSKPKKTVCD